MKHTLFLVLFCACSPTVTGRALSLGTGEKRVAVAGSGYLSGVENALMQLASGKMKLLSRSEQEAIAKEKSLQYSGDFSDDAVVSLGRQVGAELLFVVKDETQKTERQPSPNVKNCDFYYSAGQLDSEEEKSRKADQRKDCEKTNEAERKRAAAAPPQVFYRYRTNVRVIDLTTGEVVAFGDADVADGQAGLLCVFPCTKDKASDLAVRAILGMPTKD